MSHQFTALYFGYSVFGGFGHHACTSFPVLKTRPLEHLPVGELYRVVSHALSSKRDAWRPEEI